MTRWFRAFTLAAFLGMGLAGAALPSAQAADKAFQRDDLADSAIRLEAEIKSEAGAVNKPINALRTEIDAALKKNDTLGALRVMGQAVAVAPADAANWLRLAKIVYQVPGKDSRERTFYLERASTAAYIAYQRATNANEEADALATLSRAFSARKIWRPALDAMRLSLDMKEAADKRAEYEQLRGEHGFRLLDYSVDSDAASPRACFQFSEDLVKRADYAPFVSQAGQDKPAVTFEERQLCVEGLKHGERYTLGLRAGLPSSVNETMQKSAEFTIYVRDRKPFVRFTGRAYVLPKTGQRGIPLVSVNTSAVNIKIFRIGDRNLIETVQGSDFQRNLSGYELERMGSERGVKVWSGEIEVGNTLNQDVTTAFPVEKAVGDMQPGVYAMVASPKGPQGASGDDYESLATQWFIVSDLGLTAFSGNDGIHVFINSLATTQPLGGTEVRLVSRGNEILATRKTDDAGHALFEAGLARGEGGLSPAMLSVSGAKGDYAFLNLKSPAFDLSDRGVAGREVPAGLDAFVYAERGVYRSGETVYLTALARDGQGKAAIGAPMTLVVQRPDGVEYRRVTLPDQGAGGRSLALALNNSVPTGTWRVRAFADPKAPAIGEATFMVEDYVPDRIEFSVTSEAKLIAPDKPVKLSVDGRYLYGTPASQLQLEGEVAIAQASERPGFSGYTFGVSENDGEASTERQQLEELPTTGDDGKASFDVSLAKVPDAQRPFEAQILIRMAESGGRAVERKLVLPIAPKANMIGVKPLFSGNSVGEGETALFDVVLATPDGKTLARGGMRYELMKLESTYQWYRQGGSWQYEPIKSTKRVADGDFNLAADKPARLSLAPQPGRYRLDVRSADKDGPLTSVTFDVGWYAEASSDTPDLLETSIDKAEYQSGESMVVTVNARSAGKLTVHVVGDRLLTTQTSDVKEGQNQIKLAIGNDWGSGAYVVTTLRRPLDEQARRMPGRAIGLKWFGIDRKARTLQVALGAPAQSRPSTRLTLPVKIEGLARGEDAKIVIAAVDVGILNLTGYKPPQPDDYYFGQRRLTAEIRDLYGQLIDGMQGSVGAIRSGGDAPAAELKGSPPAQKPLALYSGIVTVGASGTAEVSFDLPEFAGTARIMAVAWSATKLGKATSDVIIRDPVVLTATLPRFLLTGDEGSLHLDLHNVEGPAGEYVIGLTAEGPVKLGNSTQWKLPLKTGQRGVLTLGLSAKDAGVSHIAVDIKGPNGLALARNYAVEVKPATQVLARRTVRTLAKGESLTLSGDMFTGLINGTQNASVSVTLSSALDAATILKALDRYPFGCSEQITSRALPLLYVNELASEAHLALDGDAQERIKGAIDRLLARQGSNGSFGLWSAGGDDPWLDSYVTDFLTRAREKGHAVPDVAFRSALDRLKNFATNADEPDKNGGRELAYALYVLARNGLAPVGDLRYIADTKLDALATPIARAQLAAALALMGDRVRAERVYASALAQLQPKPQLVFGREDYGSTLRDAAAFVSLASEGQAPRASIFNAVQRVEDARALTPYTSTQENAWLVLAARAIAKDADALNLSVKGESVKSALYRTYKPVDIVQPVTITNNSDAPVQAVLSVNGAPVTPEPAADHGFKIERNYFTLDGQPSDPSKAKQNQRFVVVLKITEAKPEYGRVMVVDYLPAGFEIDNPNLVSSGETTSLGWIENGKEPVHSEFRDDRFNAAFDRRSSDDATFTVAYVVRAVSVGKYVLPQAMVEDMYNPSRYGRTGTGKIEVQKDK